MTDKPSKIHPPSPAKPAPAQPRGEAEDAAGGATTQKGEDKPRERDMMQGNKSLAAGSGNTLGDGMTAGGADRVKERKVFKDS